MPPLAKFSETIRTEGKEGEAAADREFEQYCNNRARSATVVLNVLGGSGYMFQKCRSKRKDNGYEKIRSYEESESRGLKRVNVCSYTESGWLFHPETAKDILNVR